MSRLRCLVIKEFQQLRQDRKMIPMVLAFPIIQLIVFGFAANLDVKDVRTLIVDQDRSAASRGLVEKLTVSGYFEIAGSEDSLSRVDRWLEDGRAQMALVIDRGYAEARTRGRTGLVELLADGSDANSAGIALAYATRIVAADQVVRGTAAPVRLVPRVWFNPELKSRWYYVPAILVMVMMMATMILPAMAVVREKEIGTLEQLIVTPIRPVELIIGKLLPFALIGFFDLLLVVGLAVAFFRVPLTGSFLTLVLLSLPFLLTLMGMGLFVSTLAQNQQQAMMGSIYLLMLPQIYLSGLIFPIEGMPRLMQQFSCLIPAKYYTNILRGVFLKGAGWADLWPDALVLTGMAACVLTLAALRFRKRLD